MVTWAQLLDEYESAIAALELSIEAGTAPKVLAWVPPAQAPGRLPSAAQFERFQALQARAVACRSAIDDQLASASQDLQTLRRTGQAARAYARHAE